MKTEQFFKKKFVFFVLKLKTTKCELVNLHTCSKTKKNSLIDVLKINLNLK